MKGQSNMAVVGEGSVALSLCCFNQKRQRVEIHRGWWSPNFVIPERSKFCPVRLITSCLWRRWAAHRTRHAARPSGRPKNESWKIGGGQVDNVPAQQRIVTGWLPNSGDLFCEEFGRLAHANARTGARAPAGQPSAAAARHTARLRSLCVL